MRNVPSFNGLIENSIITNGGKGVPTDYKEATLQYHGVVRKVEKKCIMFEKSNLKDDGKITLCGRNGAMWTRTFQAAVTYGYGPVVVPIQYDFTTGQISSFVNQSDSGLFFVRDEISATLALVNESFILQTGDKLVELVCPGTNEVEMLLFSTNDLHSEMDQNRMEPSVRMPSYCKISEIKFHDCEFENTSKNQSNDIHIKTNYSYWAAC